MKWIRSKLVVYVSLFLVSLCFGSFIVNQKNNVSAVSKSVTINRDTDFCSIDGHNDSCDKIYIYNNRGFFDTFIDFEPKYILISSDSTFFYSGSYVFEQCQVFSVNNVSNCYGVVTNYIPGSFLISLDNVDSNYFYTYMFSIDTSVIEFSIYSYTFTFYDENPNNTPTGSLSIIENGEYDVLSYASVVVDVPDTETIVYGDYHEDLIKIYNAIIICAGVALVIYFFYCIYRMIIKTLGGY